MPFWYHITKVPEFINFIDSYLVNLRKYNDLSKLQIDLDQSFNLDGSRLSSSGEQTQ